MKTTLVLAMHGTPPNDFPKKEMAELFDLRAKLKHSEGEGESLRARYAELEAKMRAWPRTSANDPFYVGSRELAAQLKRESGQEVIVGFNDFCGPTIDQALEQAITTGSGKIIVITPMMTKGGEHSKVDIPAAIERARKRHPDVPIHYAWPFDTLEIARFLAAQIKRYL